MVLSGQIMFLLYFALLLFPNSKTLNILPNFENNACQNYEDYPLLFFNKNCYHDPRVMSDSIGLIRNQGLQVHPYEVTTSEGYILTILRIIKDNKPSKGQPVFMQHGLFTDSSAFLQMENRTLAFHLVERGYDVWMGNTRTTRYGRKHVLFNDTDEKFWDFSLDNLAADLRDSLIKVAKVTGKGGEIIYIGHSMGTTLGFMYAAEYSEEKLLKGIIALSPVVYLDLNRIETAIMHSLPFLNKLLHDKGIYALFKNTESARVFFQDLCKMIPVVCRTIIPAIIFGRSKLFKAKDLTTYYSYFPNTIGVTQLDHYRQMIASSHFEKYDWGPEKNLQKYGHQFPFQYNLENIKLPVYSFFGKNDILVTNKSIQRFYDELGSTDKFQAIVPIGLESKDSDFGHIEFLIADEIEVLFYNDLWPYLDKLKAVSHTEISIVL